MDIQNNHQNTDWTHPICFSIWVGSDSTVRIGMTHYKNSMVYTKKDIMKKHNWWKKIVVIHKRRSPKKNNTRGWWFSTWRHGFKKCSNQKGKLAPKWEGPFIIKDWRDKTQNLHLDQRKWKKVKNTWHSNNLCKYY